MYGGPSPRFVLLQSGCHFGDDFGMIGRDISCFLWIFLEVIQQWPFFQDKLPVIIPNGEGAANVVINHHRVPRQRFLLASQERQNTRTVFSCFIRQVHFQ